MGERLKGKAAIVAGAGQSPGETIGNGRAAAILYAREGARVLVVDRRIESALETKAMIDEEGGVAQAFEADVTEAQGCRAMAEACLAGFSRVDVLHNNVGGLDDDRGILELGEETWHRLVDLNLTSMMLACQAVLPHMIAQGAGAIVNISSVAAVIDWPLLAYRVSKAGVNALTQSVAMTGARHGVRANAVLPGLMDTPFAVESIMALTGQSRDEVVASRDAQVPLKGVRGEGWDVARASLFLASDEARFITGALLPVDGGQLCAGGASRAVGEEG